ncbi:MAG: glycosyltransferase, partial [Prevotella sp.]|nr:glycosyltransferase [Prevotella sp.]
MKVLHYIPNFKKSMGQAARFVQMLQVVMGKTVETHIISGNISKADFYRRIEKLQPDIIHIHGCWSFKAAIVESWALRNMIPVVLSPHNGLSPKELQADFWKSKLPSLIAYQFLSIRKAMVLHVTSSQELEDIKQLGWKKRVALIPEPSNENEHPQTTETFRALYQKVIDTVQRNKLSEKEEKCIWTLLLASISMRHASQDARTERVQECPDMLQQLSVHNWKNIQVYAIDHGIMEELLSGAKVLSLQLPIHVNALPARFKVKSTISDGHISDKEHGIIWGCTSSQ